MGDEDLEAFLERWKGELLQQPSGRTGAVRRVDGKPNEGVREPGADGRSWRLSGETRSDCASAAAGPPQGRISPPGDGAQATSSRRKRQGSSSAEEPPCRLPRNDALVQQLIQDLNEMNDIPFFDVDLPYELALKIFQCLDRTDLGRCAQVSKPWKVLAEDELLWYRLCLKEGYHSGAGVSDSPCWKSTLRDCKKADDTLRYNWKNRIGTISNLQYELGRVLCDVSSCDDQVIAGYTSGDIRLWDTLHWDSRTSYLRPCHVSAGDGPLAHVSRVKVNEGVAVAAYEDGLVNVWSTETGQEPIHLYQHLQKVQNVALGSEGAAVATASGPQVRLDSPLDGGYWTTLCQAELPKPVESLLLVPKRRGAPLAVAAAGESVYLLEPEREPSLLHSVYGHPVTCLDVTPSHVALGVKRQGWAVSDGGNKIQVYNLLTGQSEVTVGSALGDFTCIDLRDGLGHLLVCGNRDQRVRVFDLRCGSSVASLCAHHLGVTAVQADDWKIVSGGGEGLVCVWEMRMGAKLWEMHNRHPVRHVRFGPSRLVTANIPQEKTPRGACITDDDLTAHRRHRGVVYVYDFSENTVVPDHVLAICRSDYTENAGYNYNIGLAVPYDAIAGSQGAV